MTVCDWWEFAMGSMADIVCRLVFNPTLTEFGMVVQQGCQCRLVVLPPLIPPVYG